MSSVAATLRLTEAEREELTPLVRLVRFAAQERVQSHGEVPQRMSFIVDGRVQLVAAGEEGVLVPVRMLERGDFLGQTALTREPVIAAAYALDEVTVLEVDREHVAYLVERKPVLLQEIGRTIEERRENLRRAMSATAE